MRRTIVALLVLMWAGACSDSGGPDDIVEDSDLSGVVISDPLFAVAARAAPVSAASQDEDERIFASLGTGTASGGVIASVMSSSGAFPVWTTIREGGFDPVAVFAAVDDSVQIDVRNAMGASVYTASVPVRGSRRPKVVRTFPPPRKRDVPLNSSVVIVFSEPVDPTTISSATVRLQTRGGNVVPGNARVMPGGGTTVAFTPSAPLARNTDYLLSITQGVADFEGEALETAVAASFQTGQATVGAPVFVDVNPDTVYVAGATYQMSLTVQDAAGNALIDQPVTWESSDPNGLTVSTTGLVTPIV
ncbi:MAG TPA: Ig-like domain-containing protein, partial [Vicinamibacterales bacterium]|nr:Ig-like domain-containing protein [Vicinamibacterales bacterium]